VTTDFGAELATSADPVEAPSDADGATVAPVTDVANGVGGNPVDAKPAIGVTTDFGAASAEQTAASPTSASACAAHRDAIELGLSRGRNAMAIWQDLVDSCGFAAGYQSVRRFIWKFAMACNPGFSSTATVTMGNGPSSGRRLSF